jgi:5-methylcytosine-specific restriction endonuclease McrA
MNLSHEFNPVPKPVTQRKDKQRRKGKAKIPKKRKKKNPQVYKGRKIPSKKKRGEVSKREYNLMIENFGSVCVICGNPYISAHHVKFRSHEGRGKWRNLMPLCVRCHRRAHDDKKFADWLRQEREKRFGPWYWADEYDLFKANLIPNTTKEMFERFMKEEEERARLARMATESDS